MRSATAVTWLASAAETVTLLMNVTPRSFFITVVYGVKSVSSRSWPMVDWPFVAITPTTVNGWCCTRITWPTGLTSGPKS